jgi:hypothetical protein
MQGDEMQKQVAEVAKALLLPAVFGVAGYAMVSR